MRRKKKEYLIRRDNRLDISPGGRNIFISKDKQAYSKEARRIHFGMQLVSMLLIAGVVAIAGLFLVFYFVPYFRSEFGVNDGVESSEVSIEEESSDSDLSYDELGLPKYDNEQSLFVINTAYPAELDFEPELTEVASVEVNTCIADALRMMISDAREQGLTLLFTDGYISGTEQQEMFEAKVEELTEEQELTVVMARTEAAQECPAGGESDFQTGMCLRLDANPETFETSKTYNWLKANMGKYGFVFRFPEYKEEYTGCMPDPTVIRYVGADNASAMQQRSMCLEEYISYLDSQ